MTGLRLREGVEVERLCGPLGSAALERTGEALRVQAAQGRIEERDGRVTLTDAGFLFADGVARALLTTLHE